MVSHKTTIISSSAELVTRIQGELRKYKVVVNVAASGRDVGCDLAGGSRRRVTLQKNRIGKVRSASRVITSLGKKFKHFRKSVFTGVKSRFFGFAVQGAAPTTVRHTLAVQFGRFWVAANQVAALPLVLHCMA